MRHEKVIVLFAACFVALACLSLIAIDGWRSAQAYSQQMLELERSSANLARAMAQHADATLSTAALNLHDVVERIETDGTDPIALARLQKVMVQRVASLPLLHGLFVYDHTGAWVVNSRPTLDRRQNNSDREYFTFHQQHLSKAVRVGSPVISKSTGQWIIPVTSRINHKDGTFAGVALASINVDYFIHYYDAFDLGKNGAAGLVSQEGILLLRRPFNPQSIGKSVASSSLFVTYLLHGPHGSGLIKSNQDGEVRMNSYRTLAHFPLFATAALAKEEGLAHWRADTLLHTSVAIFFSLLLAFSGKRLVQQIQLRVKAEAALQVVRDSLKQSNAQLALLSMQDALTGLANRRQFDVTLASEFDRAMRSGDPLGLILIDIDFFKRYNDHEGHVAGDGCLRAVCNAILTVSANRAGDLAARYGGEEMAVILPGADDAGTGIVAEKIVAAVARLALPHGDSPLGVVTVSVGVASCRRGAGMNDPLALIAAADVALYQAKNAGRNRACRFIGEPLQASATPACQPDRPQADKNLLGCI